MVTARQAQRVSAEAAAAQVRSHDWVDYGFGLSQPDAFDRALARRAEQLQQVKVRSALTVRSRAILDADPEGEHFLWFNWHFSGYDRKQHDAGRCNYIPMNFGEAPDYYRRFVDPIDVACIKTAPMDEHGNFNLGCSTTYLRAMLSRARVVIVETTTAMPRVPGPDNAIHAGEVDFVVDDGDAPLAEITSGNSGAVEQQVARLIAAEIEDGACLQIGIGGMPNAVCSLLRDANVRNLGIHTEMLVDGIADLIEAGIVTNACKQIDTGRTVFSFALGSGRLYRLIDGNAAVSACPVDYTNLPINIARNRKVVSINNTTQIDLQGQAASESCGHRHVSGTGGQLQFVRGAYASEGGKSFLCLSSTFNKGTRPVSRFVATLTPGNIVTTPRTDTMYVVSEYGMVNLKGKSVAERALALISIAHPDYREELERAARAQNIIPKGFVGYRRPISTVPA
ncbi:MAG: acetyl-CoA hydrolase/transferase C-terminal domain-containing protein [Steroidobacteraceae bacterium]